MYYHRNDVQHWDTVTKSKLQMNLYYSAIINSIEYQKKSSQT